ncbi:alpha/beta hydrolase [Bdellovibrio sp. HCB209]|uniref:alpha/beta hydrolase n=1 Tax=Bdellovibrio sp. HCB209 TaxID=3394354 RepID=UPI0039B5D4DF
MRFTLLFALSFLIYLPSAFAYTRLPIWPSKVVSGTNTVTDFSKDPAVKNRAVTNVESPEIIHVPPVGKSNQSAILIIPGGGYSYIMEDSEGLNVAEFLAKKGYTCFVLLYRMPKGGSDARRTEAFADVQRAMRVIRSMASQYKIATNKIGVMGFSAGGYLAANISNNPDANNYSATDGHDRASARPDFTVLMYSVLSMKDGITHNGSRSALYGNNLSDSNKQRYSQDAMVTAKTPPTFIVHALNDSTVVAQGSLAMFEALRKNKVLVEMHLFQSGTHGFGIAQNRELSVRNWPNLFSDWQSFLGK